MSVKMASCVRCNREMTKKKTKATDIQMGAIYHKRKKKGVQLDPRTHAPKTYDRCPSVYVGKVTRVCRDSKGCAAYLKAKAEEAAKEKAAS